MILYVVDLPDAWVKLIFDLKFLFLQMSLLKQMKLLQFLRFIFERDHCIRDDFFLNFIFLLFDDDLCLSPAHDLAILHRHHRILSWAYRRY